MVLTASLLSNLLGIAASFLGVSLLVQVFQEIYKFLTSSKSRAYRNALNDFLGPWVPELLRADALPDIRVRGPLQLRRLRPGREILPLEAKTLAAALERTAPPWHRRALDALALEAELQAKGGGRTPSPMWHGFLDELARAERGSPGYHSAVEVAGFLRGWAHRGAEAPERATLLEAPEVLNAEALRSALREAFLPHVRRAEQTFPQFQQNLEYAWRRRNLRQTAVIGLLTAILFNLPVDRLYRLASSQSPEEAVAVAERALALYERTGGTPSDSLRAQIDSLLAVAVPSTGKGEGAKYLMDWSEFRAMLAAGPGKVAGFLLGCALTALLVSFGAPFWHDLARALLRLQQGPSAAESAPPATERAGA